MTKALVAFGSTSGNTQDVAGWISKVLTEQGIETETVDCVDVAPDGLCAPYDLVVFGCPTYGDDEVEIQEDFEPVLEELEDTGIRGKKVAVFGLGDDTYEYFCGAVDAIEERVAACGGTLVAESIRINDPHGQYEDEVRSWARRVAEAARS